ncbi:MAG: hypothetical protein V3U32_00305 [Anaerolineales bacterium]
MNTQVHMGLPVKVGDGEITPYSRATTVIIPGIAGGLVWNRPAGVIVKQSDGKEVALLIRDATRIAQVTLLAIGLLGGLTAWLFLGRRD